MRVTTEASSIGEPAVRADKFSLEKIYQLSGSTGSRHGGQGDEQPEWIEDNKKMVEVEARSEAEIEVYHYQSRSKAARLQMLECEHESTKNDIEYKEVERISGVIRGGLLSYLGLAGFNIFLCSHSPLRFVRPGPPAAPSHICTVSLYIYRAFHCIQHTHTVYRHIPAVYIQWPSTVYNTHPLYICTSPLYIYICMAIPHVSALLVLPSFCFFMCGLRGAGAGG